MTSPDPLEAAEVAAVMRSAGDRVAFWRDLLGRVAPRSACEIGVWRGEFAAAILDAVPSIERYALVDPWRWLPDWNKPANRSDDLFKEIRAEALGRVAPHGDRVVELRGTTREVAGRIEDASLDFAYVDGDHTLRGIAIDLITLLPKMRRGAVIGGDDFARNVWQHGAGFTPSHVFPFAIHFAEAHGLRIHTLRFNQFLIVNDDSRGFELIDHANYAAVTIEQMYAMREWAGPDESYA